MSTQFFRANVGVVVARDDGRVLVFERLDKPGQWQFPQGGLDKGEEPRAAAMRELREETGITPDRVEPAAEYPDWLAYELPPDRRRRKTGRGQVQRWFLLRFTGTDDDIELVQGRGVRQEFSRFRWVDPAALLDEVWEVRRPIYSLLLSAWSEVIASWGGKT